MRMGFAVIALALTSSSCSREADLPARYRGLRVPEERLATPEARAHGQELFLRSCALCHGERGDGHGARTEGLRPPARDLTDLAFQRRMTPRRIFATIREGRHETAMPAMPLSDEETWDLVAFVSSLGGAAR